MEIPQNKITHLKNSSVKKFQILSDLHIEEFSYTPNPEDYVIPDAENLILAGDIGSFYKIEQLTDFLVKLCKKFKRVFYIPGNHEWYMMKDYEPLEMYVLEKRMYSLTETINNLYILNRSFYLFDNILIIGATLWSRPKCNIPPFIIRIKGFKTNEYYTEHMKDLNYIKEMLKISYIKKYQTIVVTHHPPTEKVLEIMSNKRKKFSSLYATNLDYLLDKNIVNTWICGHIHKNFDFYSEKGCRIVSNQKGKYKDRIIDFKKNFSIEIFT